MIINTEKNKPIRCALKFIKDYSRVTKNKKTFDLIIEDTYNNLINEINDSNIDATLEYINENKSTAKFVGAEYKEFIDKVEKELIKRKGI